MIYLSKLILPVNRKIDNVYQLHQLLWKAFSNGAEKERDYLFRLESRTRRGYVVLVQSRSQPQWDQVLEADEYEMKSFDPIFSKGERYLFFLRANAVVSQRSEKNKRGKKVPLAPAAYVDQAVIQDGVCVEVKPGWLSRRAEDAGFRVSVASNRGRYRAEGWSKGKKSKPPIVLIGQDLDGVLEVTDSDRFYQTYVNGLGRGKGFGFGLLSLSKG